MTDASTHLSTHTHNTTGRAVRVLQRYPSSSSSSSTPKAPKQHQPTQPPSPGPSTNTTHKQPPSPAPSDDAWDRLLLAAAGARRPAPRWAVEAAIDGWYKVVAQRLLRVVLGEQGLLRELEVGGGDVVWIDVWVNVGEWTHDY